MKARHAARAFDGEGARRFGGRWNPPGTRVVYAAGSLSLAVLELLVHLGSEDPLHGWVWFELAIPAASVERLAPRRLPRDWRAFPPPAATQRLGADWLRRGRRAALEVPSAVVPREHNYVLAPEHPDFARIRIGRPTPLDLDPRLR